MTALATFWHTVLHHSASASQLTDVFMFDIYFVYQGCKNAKCIDV